jgi:hypothetical protein
MTRNARIVRLTTPMPRRPEYRVTDADGNVITRGSTVTDFRGDVATFDLVTRGPEYNGTARVCVTWDDGKPSEYTQEYYANVFDLTVVTVA